MSDEKRLRPDYFPTLRSRVETETTPDYLNYLSDTIELAHNNLLKEHSPFYKILTIFNTKKPLGLNDIKSILDEVQKLKKT